MVVQIACDAILTSTIVLATYHHYCGLPVRMAGFLGTALRRGVALFLTYVFASVLILIATSVMIIPGLFMAAALFVALPVCIVEDLRPNDSLWRSATLLRGHYGTAFGLFMLMFLTPMLLQFFFSLRRFMWQTFGLYGYTGLGVSLLVEALGMLITSVVLGAFYFEVRALHPERETDLGLTDI